MDVVFVFLCFVIYCVFVNWMYVDWVFWFDFVNKKLFYVGEINF